MEIRELLVPGAFEIVPRQIADDRGVSLEWYRFDVLAEAVGHPLDLRQGNVSVSRRGTVRGIHFADVPRGQAKYVTVPAGSALDFVVDLRTGSPSFGVSDSVLLDTVDRRAVYLPEGVGHCVLSLEDDTVMTYLMSDLYRPEREHTVDPLDPAVGLELPIPRDELILSARDLAAPGLREAERTGLLPSWEHSVARTAEQAGARS